MKHIKSALLVAALSLPFSVFAQSGSAGTTVDTAGILAVGAGQNPGTSRGFENAVNNAFNGNSGNGDGQRGTSNNPPNGKTDDGKPKGSNQN